MTPELLAHIKAYEGFRGAAYLCPAGVPTIGYGHVIPSLDHAPITEPEAEALLIEDIGRYEAMALRMSAGLKDEPPHRLDAITDFCFNLGGARYSASVLRLRVNEKRWREAAEQNDKWVYATNPRTGRKEALPGLVKRRAVTSQWLEQG